MMKKVLFKLWPIKGIMVSHNQGVLIQTNNRGDRG